MPVTPGGCSRHPERARGGDTEPAVSPGVVEPGGFGSVRFGGAPEPLPGCVERLQPDRAGPDPADLRVWPGRLRWLQRLLAPAPRSDSTLGATPATKTGGGGTALPSPLPPGQLGPSRHPPNSANRGETEARSCSPPPPGDARSRKSLRDVTAVAPLRHGCPRVTRGGGHRGRLPEVTGGGFPGNAGVTPLLSPPRWHREEPRPCQGQPVPARQRRCPRFRGARS